MVDGDGRNHQAQDEKEQGQETRLGALALPAAPAPPDRGRQQQRLQSAEETDPSQDAVHRHGPQSILHISDRPTRYESFPG